MSNKIIEVNPSYYRIPDVDEVPYIINNELSKWNAAYFRREPIGFYYDAEKKELRIPRGYPLESLQNIWKYREVVYTHTNKPNDNLNISLMNPPRNYVQESILAFMLGVQPYEFTSNDTQIYVDLPTGEGKTFAGIATMCYYRCKTLVISPNIEKVTDQWIDSILKFTNLKRNEFLHVKGAKMCADIIKGKYKDIKVFIVQRSTILAFVKKYDNNWEMLTRLVDSMDAKIKIIDEAHMDFNTIVNIDCFTDIGKTYYMSASPSRSDKNEKLIYNRIFSKVPKYGGKIKTKEQNHIIPLILQFKSTPTYQQLKDIKTRYGTSLAKYGEYLLDPEGARDEFLDAYTFALYLLLRFRRNGGKILVLGITIDFCEQLKKYTESIFPYLKTGLFVGSGKKKEKAKELDADIIFSTTKSMGTGSEFKNHQSTINTLTYASEIMANQVSGRIRKQEGRKGIYCEIVNIAHEVARKHYLEREKYLKKKAKDGIILTQLITQDDIYSMNKFFEKGYKYNSNGMIMTKDNKIIIHKIKHKKGGK